MDDILIVDDEQDIRELIAEILGDEGFKTRLAKNSEECMAEIMVKPPSLLILDIWLKDSQMDGIDILKSIKSNNPDVPVVIISGHGNIEIAVAAIKQGAYDFIEKPFNTDQLLVVIKRAFETSKLRRENASLRVGEFSNQSLIGESPLFKTMLSKLEKVANSNARVMLYGGPGSGKEIAARTIHKISSRNLSPFVTVDCSSMDPMEQENILLGIESSSGKVQMGLFEKASGGMIYFDEVSELKLETQQMVVRALTDPNFKRVGGTTILQADFRVVSSSSKNLENEVQSGSFISELFHRLNVVPIYIPSLEDRREDIPLLSKYFIEQFNLSQGLPLREVSTEAYSFLQTMKWPGNIRQLRNLIERVLILGAEKDIIKLAEVKGDDDPGLQDKSINLSANFSSMPLREARECFERIYLLTQINRFGGNISKTATFVGMERSALHRKLKSLKISSSLIDTEKTLELMVKAGTVDDILQ